MVVLDLRMFGVALSLHMGVKSVLVVGLVFHNANGTVRFMKGVLAFHFVSITFFVLLVDVVMMRIVHFVLVLIVRERLYTIFSGKTHKWTKNYLHRIQSLYDVLHHLHLPAWRTRGIYQH